MADWRNHGSAHPSSTRRLTVGAFVRSPPYERWLAHLFDHPVTKPAWYWSEDADRVEMPPRLLVAHTTRLFQASGDDLLVYADAQVNQGLWFLVSTSEELFALRDAEVPLGERVACIRSIPTFFERVFATRCTPHLSHNDEAGASPLNLVCYMWWDIFPLCGRPDDPSSSPIDSACLDAMERCLALASVACQESALHGLGHWVLYYPERCSKAVNAFLDAQPQLPTALVEYARSAREGAVL